MNTVHTIRLSGLAPPSATLHHLKQLHSDHTARDDVQVEVDGVVEVPQDGAHVISDVKPLPLGVEDTHHCVGCRGENRGQEGEGDGQNHVGHSPEHIVPLGFRRSQLLSGPARSLCGQRQVWGHKRAVVACFPVKTETGVGSQEGRCRVFSCEDRDRCGVTIEPLSCVFLCGQRQVWGHNWAVVECFSLKTDTGSEIGPLSCFP